MLAAIGVAAIAGVFSWCSSNPTGWHLGKLAERNHEGSNGSASSSVKDPRETYLKSEGYLS